MVMPSPERRKAVIPRSNIRRPLGGGARAGRWGGRGNPRGRGRFGRRRGARGGVRGRRAGTCWPTASMLHCDARGGAMVTGFNTEIECEDIRYHTQTEVMPSQDAAILTLVYKAGAIIDRVKRNYREILGEAPTREEVRFLAERQHRRVIEAIQERHGMTP